MNRQHRRQWERRHGGQWHATIEQARQKWLRKMVQFDLGRGEGVQYGKVTSISDGGDVVVECAGAGSAVALMMSLGYVERTLTLVDE